MEKIIEIINTVSSDISGLIVPVAIMALVICGIWYIVASRQGKQEVMSKLKDILIGALIALSASSIIAWVADKLAF